MLFFLSFISIQEVVSQDEMTITFEDIVGCPGDVVCIDATVENFDNIFGFDFLFNFDPSVLQLDTLHLDTTLTKSPLKGMSYNKNLVVSQGWFYLLWFEPNADSVSLADNTVIFELCFTIIGDAGSTTTFTKLPGSEYYTPKDIPNTYNYIPINFNSPLVDINSCGDFDILLDWCSPTPQNNNSGVLRVSACCDSPPYTFMIDGGIGSGTILNDNDVIEFTGISAGTYNITMTDANGTTVTETFTINSLPQLEASALISSDPKCWNKSNGRISTDLIGGGTEPYKLEWSTGEFFFNVGAFDSKEIEGLSSGTYYVTITDATGCSVVKSKSIQADTLKITSKTMLDSASCLGIDDGSYSYVWEGDGFPATIEAVPNAHAGWNYIQVEGMHNYCKSELDSIWIQPKDEIKLNIVNTIDSIDCYGQTVPAMHFQLANMHWLNPFSSFKSQDGSNIPATNSGIFGHSTFAQTDIKAGKYIISLIDTTGCRADSLITITQPDSLFLLANISPPTCLGDNGEIILNPQGGTPNYTYNWNGGITTKDRIGLGDGIYTPTVTDANGCTAELSPITFQNVDGLQIRIDTIQLIQCGDPNSGSLNGVILTGGTNYRHEWFTSAGLFSSDLLIENLSAGTYYLRVIDTIDLCLALDTVTLVAPPNIDIDSNVTMPTCSNTNDASIAIIINDGTAPYMIDWDGYPASQDQLTLSSLGEGHYTVTISDSNDCSIIREFDITSPNPLAVSVDNIIDASCYGTNDGQATATGNNGNNGNNYRFTWSSSPDDGANNTPNDNATHLNGGEQWVYVSDLTCSSDTLFFNINSPSKIELNPTITTPQCANDCNGSMSIAPTGGNPGYTYLWNNNTTNNNITDLCEGLYEVTITDSNGCTSDTSIVLTTPDALTISIDSNLTTAISCIDPSSGIITTNTDGGTGNLIFNWTNNISNTNSASGLSSGTYTIAVTDENGCTDSVNYTLAPTDPVIATIANIVPIECFGGETCIGIEHVSGGIGTYTFSINNSQSIPIDSCITVTAGEYNIKVFDKAACYYEEDIIVIQPSQTILTITPEDPVYNLGEDPKILNLNISNNNAATDSIVWIPDTELDCMTDDCTEVGITPTTSISYQVILADVNGCVAKTSVTITVKSNRNVYFPNIFNPVTDDENNLFAFDLGPGVEKLDFLYIFDRWGNRMYSRENILPGEEANASWDGTYKGQLLEPGVFMYTASVSFIDGKVIPYTGSITIIR